MFNLNDDLIRKIGYYLNFKNILSFSIVNKEVYELFDDNFYKNMAIKLYGKEFWKKTLSHPLYNCIPLKFYKNELKNIQLFQYKLYNLEIKRWGPSDFYNYYKTINKKQNEKIKYF